ncbi:hypothetical protein KI387_017298, partial [Taxus chinensis]
MTFDDDLEFSMLEEFPRIMEPVKEHHDDFKKSKFESVYFPWDESINVVAPLDVDDSDESPNLQQINIEVKSNSDQGVILSNFSTCKINISNHVLDAR